MENGNEKLYIKKILLFVIGWLTVPFITGGILYDLFGDLNMAEIWHRLTHPREIIESLGIYTIAYFSFKYLPEEISQANWFLRIVYFILFYIILSKGIDLIF